MFSWNQQKNMRYISDQILPDLVELYFVGNEYMKRSDNLDNCVGELAALMGEDVFLFFKGMKQATVEGFPKPATKEETNRMYSAVMKAVEKRENQYLSIVGENSLYVIKSALKSPVSKITELSKNIREKLERLNHFDGINIQFSSGDGLFIFGLDLETLDKMRSKTQYIEEELFNSGKNIENLTAQESIELSKKVNERMKNDIELKELERTIAKRLGEYFVNMTKKDVTEKLTDIVSGMMIQALEDIKDQIPVEKYNIFKEFYGSSDFKKLQNATTRISILYGANTFDTGSYGSAELLEFLELLDEVGGVKADFGEKMVINSDYTLNFLISQQEFRKRLIDQLKDTALRKGLDAATSEESMKQAIKEIYKNPENYKTSRSEQAKAELVLEYAANYIHAKMDDDPDKRKDYEIGLKLREAFIKRMLDYHKQNLDKETEAIWKSTENITSSQS